METKHDIIIIGVPKDDKPTTIRRRYEENDYDRDVHDSLEDQVNYDTNEELAELDQMYYQTIVMDKKQAVVLLKQLKLALDPSNHMKIFATEV